MTKLIPESTEVKEKPFKGLLDIDKKELEELSTISALVLSTCLNMEFFLKSEDKELIGKAEEFLDLEDDALEYYKELSAVLEEHKVPHTKPLSVCISMLSRNNEEAALWAYTVFLMAKELEHEVTILDLIRYFPNWKFPSGWQCSGAWKAQKRGNDNFLESEEAWK